MDHYIPGLLRSADGTYHSDGQIKDEVYVYGSFTQSKMYHNNVRCSDCHNPHSTKLKFEGNQLCLQCHKKEDFDTPKHHFHNNGSEGAQCINCHMPGKHYMVIDFRRDHSLRVPRPDLSVKHGTPNACNMCHTDKTAQWAADAVVKNYGPTRKPHFSDIMTEAVKEDFNEPEKLITLINDPLQPVIVRATALSILLNFPSQATASTAMQALKNKEALLRYTAIEHFSNYDASQRLNLLAPLLSDSVRAVRTEAYSKLGDFKEAHLPPDYRPSFNKAEKEYLDFLDFNSDTAPGKMNEGILYQRKGDLEKTKAAYLQALKINNRFNNARANLAQIYRSEGKFKEAEKLYLKILEQEPYFGPGWNSLALLYRDMKKYDKAIEHFKVAREKMPDNILNYYFMADVYKSQNKLTDAAKAYAMGLSKFKGDQRSEVFLGTLKALIELHIYMGNKAAASQNLEYLTKIVGQRAPFVKELIQKIQRLP